MEHLKSLPSFLEESVRNRVFPGAVLFVRHQGNILFHEAVGSLSFLPDSPPVQRDTLYDVASLTKPLCTVSAILLLVQEGVFDLGVSLASLLDESKNMP
ncbi:MAG: serine hydrolase domain-containing protein [Nitrospirales bacterium]